MKFLEFFSESNGQLSNMRLNSTLLIVAGIFCGVFGLWTKQLDANVIALSFGFVGMGLTGKVIQKTTEEKAPNPPAQP